MPNAMPNVQNTAIAESSRISFRLLSHSTPKADKTANKAADRMGEMPVYNPRPIPPKDACVNPPLMNTSLRVTMYVPISPQAMLASRLPMRACWKKCIAVAPFIQLKIKNYKLKVGCGVLGMGVRRRSPIMRNTSSLIFSGRAMPRNCRLRTHPATSVSCMV